MSAKNANNNAENAKNGKAAKSMTEHYTLGHKAVAVAMSTVMLGFGVPVNAPKDAYADSDAAAEQPADSDSTAKKSTEDSSAKKLESSAATDSSSAKSDSSSTKASSANSSSAKETAKAEQKTTADVALSLGNASIKYKGQTIAAPTTKVTVPTKNAFKFTVAADNGYTLTKVTVKVSGKESTLTADANGVYTVSAADVLTGASVKLVTEKQVQAQPAASTTPIQDTESDGSAAQQPASQPAASDGASAGEGQQDADASNGQEDAADNAGESGDQQSGEGASADDASDADESDSQAESSDASQLQALGNQFVSMLSDSGSAISGPTSVAQADTITLTYNGDGTPQFWNGGDGLFSTWEESADHKTLTLTATSNWAFSGSSKNTTIYCAYVDANGVWHTAGQGAEEFTVTVTKRSFTMVQPDAVAEGEDHFWIPSIIDSATGKVINLTDAPSGSFLPFEYYRDGVKIENASQYYHDASEFKKPGKYTVVIKPNNGWIYDFQGEVTVVVPTVGEEAQLTTDDPTYYVYDGQEHKWAPTVTDQDTGKVLTEGTDYELFYDTTDFTDAGTVTVTITGKGDYAKSSATKSYEINKKQITVYAEGSKVYNGEDQTLDIAENPQVNGVVEGETLALSGAIITGRDRGVYTSVANGWNWSVVKSDNSDSTGNYEISLSGKLTIIKVWVDGKDVVKTGEETTYTPGGDFTSDVTWSSSDPSILEIDPVTGKATGVYPGKVTIYAVDKEGHMASKEVTVVADEKNGCWVYVYTKVYYDGVDLTKSADGRAKARELGLAVNDHGWFTLGRVWMNNMKAPSGRNKTNADYWSKTVANLLKIERHNENGNINLNDIIWTAFGSANGADGYGQAGTWTWHLDGRVDISSMTNVNVHHVEKDTGKELGSEQIATTVGNEFDPASQKRDFEGYTFDSADAAFVPEEGQVRDVYLYYTKGTFPYTVKYVDKETGEELHVSATHGGEYGAEVTEDALDIKGYEVDEAQKTMKIGTGSNTITFYYTKKAIDYTVNYYVNGTTEKVADSKTVSGSKYGDSVTADQPAVGGYTLVPGQTPTITLSEDTHEINVYYYKNVELTAKSGEKEYTGEVQSVSGFTGAPEGADFSSISVGAEGTDAGTYPAKFPEGTKGTVDGSGKYIVTNAIDGQLVINPIKDEVVVKIKGATKSVKYDGTEQSASGYKVDSISNDALKEADFGLKSGVAAYVKGTNADTYYMGLNPGSFTLSQNAASNFTNVKFEVEDGQLSIAKRDVTLTSGSDEKVYDGTSLTKDAVTVSGDGFVGDEGADYSVTGAQTDVGDSDNTFGYTLNSNTKADNYNIKTKFGNLKITPMTDTVKVVIAGKSGSETYDGTTKSLRGYTVKSIQINGKDTNLYHESDFAYIGGDADVVQGTDADTYDMGLTAAMFKNQNGNFKNVEFEIEDGQLTINQRPVTLTSASDKKSYDGEPLTNDQVTVGGMGFVAGQGATYKVTGSQTVVGSSKNTFEYTLNNGTQAKNYSIEEKPGKLSITPGTGIANKVTLNTASLGHIYDGTEHKLPASNAEANDGSPLVIEYSADGKNWTKDPSTITAVNVRDSKKVQVRVSSINFSDVVTGEAQLNVVPRTVTVTSQTASRVYDGTPLTKPEVIVGANLFLSDEVTNVRATGSVTNVNEGSVANTIAYDTTSKFIAENYNIVKTEGTLSITGQSIVPDPDQPDTYKGVTIDDPSDSEYDGAEHKWVPTVKDAQGNALKEDIDYTVSYDTNDFVDAKTITVTIAGAGNYVGTVAKTYKITPAPLAVTTPSASKVYDGTALEAKTGTAENISGLIGSETATVKAKGSQTEVGNSNNTYDGIEWGTAKESNYTITSVNEGILNVTPKSITDEEHGMTVGQLKDVTYNGQKQAQKPEVKDGVNALVEGKDYDLSFSNDVTNAGTVTVTVTGKGNYAGSVDRTYQILPAPLKVTTPTTSKVYDGTALTAEGSISGFVNNETADFKTTGSQIAVGSSTNTYAINWTGSAKQGNYTISEELGTLTVSEYSDEVVATAVGGTYTYDGKAHGASVQVSGLPAGYTVKEASSDATATDVTKEDVTASVDHLVIVNAAGENVTSKLKVTTIPGTIKVNPATLTVTTPSASMPYDGSALTAEGSISGFVNNESATLTTTGSQTLVGKSKNTYEIEWNDTAKESNYKIEEDLGELEVTQNQAAIMVVPQGGTKVYDGAALTSAGAVAYGLPSGYTLEAITAGMQVDAGSSLATVASYKIFDAAGNEVTSQFGNVATGNANLTVTKRPVTLTSQGGAWTYDGNAHKNETVVASTGENEGFVNGEGFDYSNFASITAVGTVANTFEYKAKNGTKADNYDVKVATQNLVVTAKSIDPAVDANMSVDSPQDVTYDANEHKWAPVVKDGDKTLVEGTDYTVTYPDGQDFTNVTGAITATITGIGNYEGTVTRTYQITPASVKLASNTHEFTYNGEYQSDDAVTVSGADALFRSQVDDLKATGKVKYVSEGKVPNTIAYTFKEGFSANNYTIEAAPGELSVKAKDIVPTAENGMAIDDPSDSVYDGQAHQWTPVVKDGDKVLTEGTDYTVSYDKTDFTNVTGDITVTIAGIGNYSGTVQKSYQITKRDVVVESESASKTYDGSALEKPNAFVSAASPYDFVSGDATYSAKGAITMPGSVENSINIKWTNDSVANNYNVILKPGTLTVAAKSIKAKDMTVGTLPDVTYNGLEQIQKPEVKDGDKVLTEGTDYKLSFSKDVTNVGTVTVTVTGEGGYAGSTQVTYRINPATLTVNTPSDTKAYDGTPLTKAGSITGFVNNETATFATTGSQTTVGSSSNTYSIDWNGTAKQSNYQISESLGTLTVTESTNEVVVTTTGETVTYDGQPHGATVTVANLPVGYTAQATSNASATDVNGEGIAATADNLVIYNTNGEDVTAQLNIKRIDGTIKVLPKQLNVTTPDASKVYDGEALTAEGSITGFVPGETATFTTTGSQTEVGDSKNTYSLDWNGNAKASNYTVSEQLGTLSVSRQTINPEDPENPKAYDGVQVSSPQDETYDGEEHKWAPTVTDKKGAELVEGTDYTVAYDKSNFTDVTGEILVTITGIGNYSGSVTRTYKINPATYYVVTDGASKTYNGSALTAPGRVLGLVNGEEVAFETTGSQTEVGSSANGYDLKFSKSAKESNYTHGTDSIGMLTVNAAKAEGNITLEGTPASKTYDGTALEAGVAKASVPTGDDVTIEYSTDGQNWTTNPSTIAATDVDDSITVQLRASSPKNYEGYVYGSEELTINKRQVNLVSETATKVFDGTALTKPEVAGWQQQGDEGFVAGEVDNVRATGSVTYVSEGTVANPIAYDTKGSFKEGNYTIGKTEGTLAITGQSIKPGDESYLGIQVSDPSDVEYDGTEHIWTPVVTDKDGNVLVEGRDYIVSYPDGQDFTNVTGAITATIAGIGNYAGTVEKSYQVTPKELTVNTESATKVYDGTPLTAGGSIAGLVGNETATVNTPNSQTEVGSAFNFATSIEWGTAQERNYTWKIGEIGTLTVTAQSIVPDPESPESYKGITIDDPSDSVYDGQEHKWAPVVKDAAGNVLVEGRDYTVTYPAGQDFTNVTGAITATIEGIGNYAGSVQKSYQITPAQLTIATGSSQKQYDGTPLTNSQLEISGLVGGDAVAARTTGSQTEVGSSANTYEITWGAVRSANYTIESEDLGTLTVTEAPAVPVTPGDNGTTVTPGGSQGGGNPVLDNVARVLEGNFNAVTGSNDNAAAVAAGEQIYDEENPLGTTYEDACWVHYYIILGMILSGIYGLGVMFRRLNHIRKLRNDMNDVMGDGDGKDPEKAPSPSSRPAGMEA